MKIKYSIFLYAAACCFLVLTGCGKKTSYSPIQTDEPFPSSSSNSLNSSDYEQTSGSSDSSSYEQAERVVMPAYIVKADYGASSILVYSLNERFIGSLYSVTLPEETTEEYTNGDRIEITYNGSILESYPAQIHADFIQTVKKQIPLEELPENYSPKDAVNDSCYVNVHEKIEGGYHVLWAFLNAVNFSENNFSFPSYLRFVQYTIEGDPLIYEIICNGNYQNFSFTVRSDTSRDTFGSDNTEITETAYQYAHRFTEIYGNNKEFSKDYLVLTNEAALPDKMTKDGKIPENFKGFFLPIGTEIPSKYSTAFRNCIEYIYANSNFTKKEELNLNMVTVKSLSEEQKDFVIMESENNTNYFDDNTEEHLVFTIGDTSDHNYVILVCNTMTNHVIGSIPIK